MLKTSDEPVAQADKMGTNLKPAFQDSTHQMTKYKKGVKDEKGQSRQTKAKTQQKQFLVWNSYPSDMSTSVKYYDWTHIERGPTEVKAVMK